MIKNKFYEAPEAELLVVRTEENFMQSDFNRERSNSASSGYDYDNDLGTI